MAVCDQAGSESEECFVDVIAPFPGDVKATEAMQPGARTFDDVTEDAQARAVWLASFGNDWADTTVLEQTAVQVEVVAAISQQRFGRRLGQPTCPATGRDLGSVSPITLVVSWLRHHDGPWRHRLQGPGDHRRERSGLVILNRAVFPAFSSVAHRWKPAFSSTRTEDGLDSSTSADTV